VEQKVEKKEVLVQMSAFTNKLVLMFYNFLVSIIKKTMLYGEQQRTRMHITFVQLTWG
jgi:hypothetical protein